MSASYELQDFQRDVVDASRQVPVVVDFWASWCGPCQALSPILERLAAEARGAWKLVTVDVDRNQALAAQFRVRSIPAVKMIVDARVVDEFSGAMPETQVREWLARHVPALAAPTAGTLEQAEALLAAGETEAARGVLEQLQDDPDARALLASLVVWDDPARAAELARDVQPDARHHDLARAVHTMARLLTLDPTKLPESPARGPYLEAIQALRSRDFERAAQRLIAALEADRSYDGDGPRLGCIALFALLGREHPVTQTWRRRFHMALH